MTKSQITSLGTALPEFKYKQSGIKDWMVNLIPEDNTKAKRKLGIVFDKSEIEYRYSVLPDFSDMKESVLFNKIDVEPPVEDRLKIFKEKALNLSLLAIDDCIKNTPQDLNEITHLITVSCTGMYAPGIEIELKKSLNLRESVQAYALNFIGCYGAFPAMRMADSFIKSSNNCKILVVCVELCTLHFQNKYTDDHFLSNSLFGDGAAAAIIEGSTNTSPALTLESFVTKVQHNGAEDMTWDINSDGFLMKLSSYVPQLVDSGIEELLPSELNKKDIQHWAIHPGGRKILEVCEKVLRLQQNELAIPYKILKDYGNMSAVTILFVLKEFMQNKYKKGDKIFACGFGPGLTMESLILSM